MDFADSLKRQMNPAETRVQSGIHDVVFYKFPHVDHARKELFWKVVALPKGTRARDEMRLARLNDPHNRCKWRNAAGDPMVIAPEPLTEAEVKQYFEARAEIEADKAELRKREQIRKAPAVVVIDGKAETPKADLKRKRGSEE